MPSPSAKTFEHLQQSSPETRLSNVLKATSAEREHRSALGHLGHALDKTLSTKQQATSAEHERRSPLGHLGHALDKTFSNLASKPEADKEASGTRPPSPVGVLDASAAEEVQEKPTFSISSWKERLRQRVEESELAEKSKCSDSFEQPLPPLPSVDENRTSLQSSASTEMSPRPSCTVDPLLFYKQEEIPAKSGLVEWLLGVFQARDRARIDHMVKTLACLAEAGDANRIEDALHVYAESLVSITREGWRMLSARYPADPDVPPQSARSLHCTVGLTPRLRGLTPRQFLPQSSSSRSSHCHSARSSFGHTGHGKRGSDLSVRSWGGTESTAIGSSRSDITYSDGDSIVGRLIQVVAVEAEDDHLCNRSPSPIEDWDSEDAPNIDDNRDDWELEYILNTVLGEVRIKLEELNTHLIESVLENARVRIFTWTVHQWRTCNKHRD